MTQTSAIHPNCATCGMPINNPVHIIVNGIHYHSDHAPVTGTPMRPKDGDILRCTICGFVIDQRFKAEKPTAEFTTRGRGKSNSKSTIIVYLKEVDAGTDNACWVVCSKGDPGAVQFTNE